MEVIGWDIGESSVGLSQKRASRCLLVAVRLELGLGSQARSRRIRLMTLKTVF